VAPLAIVYARFSSETGFARPLDQARLYSANAGSYLASAAYAHGWLLALAGKWREVLFPGLVATILGFCAGGVLFNTRPGRAIREGVSHALAELHAFLWYDLLLGAVQALLGAFRLLAAWFASGYRTLALSVLAGLAVADILRRRARPDIWLTLILAIAVVESFKPLKFSPVPPVDPVYQTLAKLPAGGVIELPLYSGASPSCARMHAGVDRALETAGWRIQRHAGPGDQRSRVCLENSDRASLDQLARDGVRYAVIHPADYSPAEQEKLARRLRDS
jgi:hypothetical protein